MASRVSCVRTLGCGLALVATALAAGCLETRAVEDVRPAYPRINLAVGYHVDPSWPKKPADLPWAAMPGLAVDAHDNVWIFTRSDVPVQVYDTAGNLVRAWGKGVFKTAHQIRIGPDGNVWVADVGRHVVEKYTPEGKRLLTLGTDGQPGCDATHFDKPTDMVATPAGDVFITDGYGNNRVAHFDSRGRFVKAWGEMGVKPGQFSLPHSIDVDSKGRLYVADRNNARVQVFDQKGTFLAEWRNLLVPWGICITAKDDIWVCGPSPMQWRDEDTNLSVPPKDAVVMKFDPTGRALQLWTVPARVKGPTKPGECSWIHGIAVDSKGNLYVGDIMGQRAQKLVVRK